MLYAVSVSFFPLATGLGIAIILDNFAAQDRKLKETANKAWIHWFHRSKISLPTQINHLQQKSNTEQGRYYELVHSDHTARFVIARLPFTRHHKAFCHCEAAFHPSSQGFLSLQGRISPVTRSSVFARPHFTRHHKAFRHCKAVGRGNPFRHGAHGLLRCCAPRNDISYPSSLRNLKKKTLGAILNVTRNLKQKRTSHARESGHSTDG